MNRNWDAAFAACKSYEEAEVSAALQAAIDAAGGLDWVTPGMRVALKLNLVSAMKPEQAATVHPAVVCALVKLLTARGAHVILGDSPGGLYTAAHLQRDYDVTGLRAAEALGAQQVHIGGGRAVFPPGRLGEMPDAFVEGRHAALIRGNPDRIDIYQMIMVVIYVAFCKLLPNVP